jgi:hypothetical protein
VGRPAQQRRDTVEVMVVGIELMAAAKLGAAAKDSTLVVKGQCVLHTRQHVLCPCLLHKHNATAATAHSSAAPCGATVHANLHG